MRIEKINNPDRNNKKTDLEKIYITEPSAIFILSDPQHKPIVRVFQGV